MQNTDILISCTDNIDNTHTINLKNTLTVRKNSGKFICLFFKKFDKQVEKFILKIYLF